MTRTRIVMGLMLTLAAIGCGGGGSDGPVASAAGASYLSSERPQDAKDVGEARKSSKNDETISVVGRIGGSTDPFVAGAAVFTIVDPAIPYCAEDEGCPTPWDYCCETDKLKDNMAMIKLVDANGQPVTTGARELLGVKELNTVVVSGKAKRDEQGNLTVLAEKVHVVKE